jgi:23S rRNA pseudouridine1911/1915/1917 synthase
MKALLEAMRHEDARDDEDEVFELSSEPYLYDEDVIDDDTALDDDDFDDEVLDDSDDG